MYWLYVLPTIARKLHGSRHLRLRSHDPAGTPAIRAFANGSALAAFFLMAGVVTVLALTFWGPRLFAIPPLEILITVVFTIYAVLGFRVGPYTYMWLYAIITREKAENLGMISRWIPPVSKMHEEYNEKAIEWVNLYQTLSSVPHLPFSTAALVQYIAALLGAVVAFAIQQIAGS